MRALSERVRGTGTDHRGGGAGLCKRGGRAGQEITSCRHGRAAAACSEWAGARTIEAMAQAPEECETAWRPSQAATAATHALRLRTTSMVD